MPGGRPKELARRHDNDGIDVTLTWRRADGRLTVVVTDQAGHRITLPARSDNASTSITTPSPTPIRRHSSART